MLVVGPRDAEQGTVSVRDRIDGDLGAMPVAAATERFRQEISERTVRKTYRGSAGLGERGATNEY
jgi:threonyl-tRNA synthetase